MVEKKKKDLGQFLLEGDFLKDSELQIAKEAAKQTGKNLAEVLSEKKLVTPETLATALSFLYGAQIVDLGRCEIQPAALALISESVARSSNVLPLSVNGSELIVAVDDPSDILLINTLASLTSQRIRPVVPLHGDLKKAVEYYYGDPEIAVREQAGAAKAAIESVARKLLLLAKRENVAVIHIEMDLRDGGAEVTFEAKGEDALCYLSITLPPCLYQSLIVCFNATAGVKVVEERRAMVKLK
ncbi:MAG: hypothetical protein V1705_00465 [bacterium]